jgi:integrase
MGIKQVGRGRWRVVARLWNSGDILHKQTTIDGTREQAKAALERLKAELRAGAPQCSLTIDLTKIKHILEVYSNAFFAREGRDFSPGHKKKVDWFEKTFGECDLPLFPERFERCLGVLRGQGKFHQANRLVEIARAAFQCCIKKKLLKYNPITEDRFPETAETARDNYLNADEVRKIILAAAKDRRTCHIARALQYSFLVPCRRSEVVNMRIGDVDIFNSRLRTYNGQTKNERGAWKPIPPSMLRWVRMRLRTARSLYEPLFSRYIKARNQVAGLGDFKHAWNTIRKRCGYPALRFHDSRHISATDMVKSGTPRMVVNAVANWKADMLRLYYHLDGDEDLGLIKWRENAKHDSGLIASAATGG